MNVNIICVGKIKEKYIVDGIKEYTKRIGAYCSIKIHELKETGADNNISLVLEKEEKELMKCLEKNKGYNILLDLKGRHYSSEGFSEKIKELMISGNSTLNFIIGGSHGVSENIRRSSDLKLKFSEFTFPHQLMRLILTEQLYRWFNIINNGKYHK